MKSPLINLIALLILLLHSTTLNAGVIDSLKQEIQTTTNLERKVELYIKLVDSFEDRSEAAPFIDEIKKLIDGKPDSYRADIFNQTGRLNYLAGNYDGAESDMLTVIDIRKRIGPKKDLAKAYNALARINKKQVKFDEALMAYQEAEKIYEEIRSFSDLVNILNKQGIIHKNLENYTDALPIYHKAYEIATKYGLPKHLASTCINIGVVLKNQEEYDEALKYYYRAEEIYEIENDQGGLADIYNNIGNVLRFQGKLDGALTNYNKAIQAREASGKTHRLAYTYNNIALIHQERKDFKKAIQYLEKSEKIKLKYEDYPSLGSTYLNFARVYLETKDEKKFVYYSELAEKIAQQYQLDEVYRDVLVDKSTFESENGNFEKAYYYLNTVFQGLDTLDEQSQRILNSVLQARFREKESQFEMSQLSERFDELTVQKQELEDNQRYARNLIIALSLVVGILVVIFILFLFNLREVRVQAKELARTNEELREANLSKEEKEVLLKEIHHRVKNNLQIIKSLIRLQGIGERDEHLNDVLNEFEQRVSSMALVHEALYKSGDLAKVDVNSYYEDLVNDLIFAYNLQQNVEAKISIDMENLGIDTLVPLGLLTNEIISNSLKHGLEANTNGIITVDLKKIEDDRCELFIGDNGKGFDFEQERTSRNSLGTELILTLVEQLDGEYEFSNEGGAYYRIRFKPQDKKG